MSVQSEISITHYVSSIGSINHTLCQLNRKYQSHIMSAQSEVLITHYVSSIGSINHTLCQLNRKYQSHIMSAQSEVSITHISSIGNTATYSRLAQSAARLSALMTATRNRQHIQQHTVGSGQLKCDGTRAGNTFRLSAKRTSPFKSAGGVSSVDYWQPSCAYQR